MKTVVNKTKAAKAKLNNGGGEVRKVFTVDAKGRSLGRVASEAASVLLGKKSVAFTKNQVLPVEVKIVNADKLLMTERRIKGMKYQRYSGYPGGLYETTAAAMIEKEGKKEILRRAVDGMLPRNSLRKERMKRLTITA
jgi:large subunit ribosomal protein L13